MKHTKKILSLALSAAMALSVMVVGAGAAFTDHEYIANPDAVESCVELNIIGGFPDGSYQPQKNVTRAQMCKMICVALNGGEAHDTAGKEVPSYPDIDGHWAEGYIECCSDAGIVSGHEDGSFDPNGEVTAVQAAKMLLVALGYDAEKEGFNGGILWQMSVNVAGEQAGIYEGFDQEPSLALSRDNAALLIWNTLNAPMVEYVTETVTDDQGQTTEKVSLKDKLVEGTETPLTLLVEKYGAQ